MDALYQHIFTQAENVSNRCSSLYIPFDCRTHVERSRTHTHTQTHTVLVYTLLRQPQHNYRSRLIIRISLPPSLRSHRLSPSVSPSPSTSSYQVPQHPPPVPNHPAKFPSFSCYFKHSVYKSYNFPKILTRNYLYLLYYTHVPIN